MSLRAHLGCGCFGPSIGFGCLTLPAIIAAAVIVAARRRG